MPTYIPKYLTLKFTFNTMLHIGKKIYKNMENTKKENSLEKEELLELNEILSSNYSKDRDKKQKIREFDRKIKTFGTKRLVDLLFDSIKNNYVKLAEYLVKKVERIKSFLSEENLKKKENKESLDLIVEEPKIIYFLIEGEIGIGTSILKDLLDNNKNLELTQAIFEIYKKNYSEQFTDFVDLYISKNLDKINYIIDNKLYDIDNDTFKKIIVCNIFSNPEIFKKIFESNLKFDDKYIDIMTLTEIFVVFSDIKKNLNLVDNCIQNIKIMIENTSLDLSEGPDEISAVFLGLLNSIDDEKRATELADLIFDKYQILKDCKNEISYLFNESIKGSRFEISNYLLKKFDLDLNSLSNESKENLIQNYNEKKFEDVKLSKIKEKIFTDLFKYNAENQQYVCKIENLNAERQGGEQVNYNRLYVHNKENDYLELQRGVAYALTKNKDINNNYLLYDVESKNDKQVITYYKMGTNEENKKNNILITAEIDKNNKIKFNFTEENLNDKSFLDEMKEDIKKIVNIDYKSVVGFDYILSYLEYVPFLYTEKDVDIIVRCHTLEFAAEIIDDIFNSNNSKVKICDLCYRGHNTQLLMTKDEILIFNTGDEDSTAIFTLRIKNTYKDIYCKDDTEKTEKINKLNIAGLKTLEQEVGNCVKVSKEFIITFMMKCYKYKKNEEKLSTTAKKVLNFTKVFNDITNIQDQAERMNYLLNLSEDEFKNISNLKEIAKKTNKSMLKVKNNSLETKKIFESFLEDFEKAESIRKSDNSIGK